MKQIGSKMECYSKTSSASGRMMEDMRVERGGCKRYGSYVSCSSAIGNTVEPVTSEGDVFSYQAIEVGG